MKAPDNKGLRSGIEIASIYRQTADRRQNDGRRKTASRDEGVDEDVRKQEESQQELCVEWLQVLMLMQLVGRNGRSSYQARISVGNAVLHNCAK